MKNVALQDLHPLDAAVTLRTLAPGRYAGAPSSHYWNGGGPFGGALAAMVLKAVLDHPERQGRPVAETVNYCATLTADPIEIQVRLVRGGRSTQHWAIDLTQAGVTAVTATIVTGVERPTWGYRAARAPSIAPASSLSAFTSTTRPGFFARYETRFETEAAGFREDGEIRSGAMRAWTRDHPARPLDYLSLAALADCFVPRSIIMRPRRGPSATVTLSTYFMADTAEVAAVGEEFVLGTADLRVARHGFRDQTVELWSAAGDLLAVSHQVVWFRD